MRMSEKINATARELCDRTVPCEVCIFNEKGYYCTSRDCAKKIIKLGYRKVAEDEIVESMKTYERARQETAREILQVLKDNIVNRIGSKYAVIDLTDIAQRANELGIELE